ncbi:Methylated-DNA--protein-cysteine methyltransferase [Pseudomonas sp. 8Z]|uniref:methylated-DNA--[protein]-cysteine S-methyltransferase n=1 Tax=Pseudomonas sp. 8Z TaxID=2653166 RepID=UPI0012F2991C|nr:methylated-DNA--[protein]-cysteine S-methyltransferase [Pseudomonas sp. 8Z]VXC38587.1 Methylated-DNA--protein-cysteine methyltransferase [Pseudomonas sp. 8Z]
MHYRYHDSPLGELFIAGHENGLHLLLMELDSHPWRIEPGWRPATNELDSVCRQLDEYFAGQRRQFELRLAPRGTTFQQAVWQALLAIPYGSTCSYSQLAEVIGRPNAVRAVGSANGANPISIIVPCHRVIGRNGSLTGYAGGLPRKQRLLELEGVLQPRQTHLAL